MTIPNIFGAFSSGLRQPLQNAVLQLLLSGAQQAWQKERKPETPSIRDNMQGRRYTFSPSQRERIGGNAPYSIAMPSDPYAREMGELTINDMFRLYDEQMAYNEQMGGVVRDLRSSMTAGNRNLNQTREGLARTRTTGSAGFRRALSDVGQTRRQVRTQAAAAIGQTKEMVSAFFKQAAFMRGEMKTLTGEVLAGVRKETAVRLKEASESTWNQYNQAMSDLSGQVFASGQYTGGGLNAMAELSASANDAVGDMLQQISGEEATRMTAVHKDMARMSTELDITLTGAGAGILQSGMAEVGATMRNLMAEEASLSALHGSLQKDHATFLSHVDELRAFTDVQQMQLNIQGRGLESNILASIREPVIQLGPLASNLMMLETGLEEKEYGYQMQDFQLDLAIEGQTAQLGQDILQAYWNRGAAEHQAEAASTARQQANTTAAVGAVLGGFLGGPAFATMMGAGAATTNPGGSNAYSVGGGGDGGGGYGVAG